MFSDRYDLVWEQVTELSRTRAGPLGRVRIPPGTPTSKALAQSAVSPIKVLRTVIQSKFNS